MEEIFLIGRSKKVRIGEEFSDLGIVTLGVPQCSVIGLLLFLIFINNFPNNLKSGVRLFVDDFIIYRKIINKMLLSSIV